MMTMTESERFQNAITTTTTDDDDDDEEEKNQCGTEFKTDHFK